MLKLDPEDSDADMDDGERPDKSSPVKGGHPQQPAMPQIDFESSIDNLGGAPPAAAAVLSQNIPNNLSNVSAFVVQNQYNHSGSTNTPAARGGRGSRGTPKKQSTAKKVAPGKKKKRRVSSSDEESDYNSDSDY